MNQKMSNFRGVYWLLAAVACSGTHLNDVGDVNTNGGGDGGKGNSDSAGRPAVDIVEGPGGEGGSAPHLPVTDPIRGGSGGTVGVGGRGVLPLDPLGGEGGAPLITDPVCFDCSTVAEEQGTVNDLEVNDEKVFWIDHGSFDKFHNYNGDGRLVARGLEGGALEVLADSLSGPVELELSDTYAYMFVDKRSSGNPAAIVRMPLTGGALETIGTFPLVGYPVGAIAPSPDFTYYLLEGSTFRVAETPGAAPELFNEGSGATALLADEDNVYLFNSDGILVVPATGGAATLFQPHNNAELAPIAIDADNLYVMESGSVRAKETWRYIVRMSKSGSERKRLVLRDDRGWYGGFFQILGDRFFFSHPVINYDTTLLADRILQGNFATPEDDQYIVRGPAGTASIFAPSSVGLFFTDGNSIRLAPYL